jgi:hypothetical protein
VIVAVGGMATRPALGRSVGLTETCRRGGNVGSSGPWRHRRLDFRRCTGVLRGTRAACHPPLETVGSDPATKVLGDERRHEHVSPVDNCVTMGWRSARIVPTRLRGIVQAGDELVLDAWWER